MLQELGSLSHFEIADRLRTTDKRIRGLRVGSDIDNTEVASTESALGLVNQKHGTNFRIDQITYDFAAVELIAKYLPDIKNPRQYSIDVWNSEENLGTAMPVSGAPSLSGYLNSVGITDIPRVTSRPGNTKDVTLSWYRRFMPRFDLSLIHMQQEGSVINPDFKIEEIKRLEIELFFEDSVDHALRIVSETSARVVLVPQRSNLDFILDKSKPKDGILIPEWNWQAPAKLVRVYAGLANML